MAGHHRYMECWVTKRWQEGGIEAEGGTFGLGKSGTGQIKPVRGWDQLSPYPILSHGS